jgi:hypothetical protein
MPTKSKHLSSKKRPPARPQRHGPRAPRTAHELFKSSRVFQEQWNRIVQVPAEMRSTGASLRQAAKDVGVSPALVTRLAGSAFIKRPNGRYEVKANDRLLRVLLIPSNKGLREVAVRDSREASLIGEYWSAVEKYLARGDASALQNLRRKRVINADAKGIRLLTNLEELKRQASAGVLRFESLYGRSA